MKLWTCTCGATWPDNHKAITVDIIAHRCGGVVRMRGAR